jgi:hypothetical protein
VDKATLCWRLTWNVWNTLTGITIMRLELSSLRGLNTPGASATLFSQWRVGAIVEAIAVRDAATNQLWLNIGNTRVPARIASGDNVGPVHGEKLQLRVLRDHPVLALEALPPDDSEAAAVSDALRRFLPRQTSPAPLLSNVSMLAKQIAAQGNPIAASANPAASAALASLPRPVRQAVEQLWQAIPNAADLETGEGLAAAVRRSGAFLESNLAAVNVNDAREVLARDVKALLVELKQALQRGGATVHTGGAQTTSVPNNATALGTATHAPSSHTPDPLPMARGNLQPLPSAAATLAQLDTPTARINELAAQTDGALSRLNSVQLVNAENAGNVPLWLIELPIKQGDHTDTLRFRFEQHARQQQGSEQSWTVEAALPLRDSGALHARISLVGNRIAVQLRADSAELVNELSARTPELTAMLSDSGLQVERIVCLHGLPASDVAEMRAATPLLDVRA